MTSDVRPRRWAVADFLLAVAVVALALILTGQIDRSRLQYVEVLRHASVVRVVPGSVPPSEYVPVVAKQVRVKAFLGSGFLRIFAVERRDFQRAAAILGLPAPTNLQASLYIQRTGLEAFQVWGNPESLYGYANREVFDIGPVAAVQVMEDLIPDAYLASPGAGTPSEVVQSYGSESRAVMTETRPLKATIQIPAGVIAATCVILALRAARPPRKT